MSKQRPMTKAEREKAKKRREQLKDAPTEMRSGSFKLPSKTKLKELRKIRQGKPDGPSKPARPSKKKDPLLVHRNGKPLSKKPKKKQKDKLKIGG
mgnify:CR=1 FL=1|tara:strand:- start:285 stop:569 length:285 start_codon:yes stop_codon:yes gene_type:complete